MATSETEDEDPTVNGDRNRILYGQKEKGPFTIHTAWQEEPNLSAGYETSRVNRDSTFNARIKTDVFRSTRVRDTQPGLFADFNPGSRVKAKRRNSVSTYLPSRSLGVNNSAQKDSFAKSENRNVFHQAGSFKSQKFSQRYSGVKGDSLTSWDSDDLTERQLRSNLSQDLTGRPVGRRHSVASVSTSYSEPLFLPHSEKDYQPQDLQSRAAHLETSCKKAGPKFDANNSDTNSLHSGIPPDVTLRQPPSENIVAARARRRSRQESSPHPSAIREKSDAVLASDEGLQNLLAALKKDITKNESALRKVAEGPDKSPELRNRIKIVGSNTGYSSLGLENSVSIHLPDTGVHLVDSREPKAPSFNDTHISLVYSKDLSVENSLDIGKCANSGSGTTFRTKTLKQEKFTKSPKVVSEIVPDPEKITVEADSHSPKAKSGNSDAQLVYPATLLSEEKDRLSVRARSFRTDKVSTRTLEQSSGTASSSSETKSVKPRQRTKTNSKRLETKLETAGTNLDCDGTIVKSPGTKPESSGAKLATAQTKLNSPRINSIKAESSGTKFESSGTKSNSPGTKSKSSGTKSESSETNCAHSGTISTNPETKLDGGTKSEVRVETKREKGKGLSETETGLKVKTRTRKRKTKRSPREDKSGQVKQGDSPNAQLSSHAQTESFCLGQASANANLETGKLGSGQIGQTELIEEVHAKSEATQKDIGLNKDICTQLDVYEGAKSSGGSTKLDPFEKRGVRTCTGSEVPGRKRSGQGSQSEDVKHSVTGLPDLERTVNDPTAKLVNLAQKGPSDSQASSALDARRPLPKATDFKRRTQSFSLGTKQADLGETSRKGSVSFEDHSADSSVKTSRSPGAVRRSVPKARDFGQPRNRSSSLDTGRQKLLVRQRNIDSSDTSSDESSDSENRTEERTKKSPLSKLKRSLTAPEGLLTLFKKTLRFQTRPAAGDIYTINEETSPEIIGAAQESNEIIIENTKVKLREKLRATFERPKSMNDGTKVQFKDLKQRDDDSVDLRRKSLYDTPGIFDKFVNEAEDSHDSVASVGTNDSVFEHKVSEISSAEVTDDEKESLSESDYDTEEDNANFCFNRFSAARTSIRRASIDFGFLDQVRRSDNRDIGEVSASANFGEDLNWKHSRRYSDGRLTGLAMAQNRSKIPTSKMVVDSLNKEKTVRDYLTEYREKFGRLFPGSQDLEQEKEKIPDRLPSSGDSDSPHSDTSHTANALANPNIRKYILQSQTRTGSRPISRSSSPNLRDNTARVKGQLLSNTEFFVSSSDGSPSDSPRASFMGNKCDSARSSLRVDKYRARFEQKRLKDQRSRSEMNLDKIHLAEEEENTDTSKSARSNTDPFPESSKTPREILALSQRSLSEQSEGQSEFQHKRLQSDSTYHEYLKKTSLKTKFHIPTFEEFKSRKKNIKGSDAYRTFENDPKYVLRGVHSKLLSQQMHASSMSALHELRELDEVAEARGSVKDSVNAFEQKVQDNYCESESGSVFCDDVLKAPPRRRHEVRRSSLDNVLHQRPQSMYSCATGQDIQRSLIRYASEQVLASDDLYDDAQKNEYSQGVKVAGVTFSESNVDQKSPRPERPFRKHRNKSRSLFDLSQTEVESCEGHDKLVNRLQSCEEHDLELPRPKGRAGQREHGLELSRSQGRKIKGQRSDLEKSKQKPTEPLIKSISEPVPVNFVEKSDAHQRSKSDKSRLVRDKNRHHRSDPQSGLDFVDSPLGGSSERDFSKNLAQDSEYYEGSPLRSLKEDGMIFPKTRKNKPRRFHKNKSNAKSTENLLDTESFSPSRRLLKAQSMDQLNIVPRSHKDKKVKGSRPVSVADVEAAKTAWEENAAPPVGRRNEQLLVAESLDPKGSVVRSTSDVSDTRKEEKRKMKMKKIRASKSDPFDEKGRRSHPKMRESVSQQHLMPDYGENILESSLSFQSIGDIDEDDDTSCEVPLKKSSGRKPKKTSNVSITSVDSGVIGHDGSHDIDDLSPCKDGTFSIERVDSGVGSDSKYANKKEWKQREGITCVDCDKPILSNDNDIILEVATICKKCLARRTERKETIQEIIDTEISYGRDLRIIKEEFYRPMENASLLTAEQTQAIFLNLQELMDINDKFADFLQDAIESANEEGDEDYNSVQIGKIFLDFSFMFIAFENYCVHQSSASLLLEQLEKDRELLRIFLQVSQRENHLLRRMNLKSFLMVPVQRIVKYPLLLTRLFKSTPHHNTDRDLIKEAQLKIEEILDHINASTKGGGSIRNRTKGMNLQKAGAVESIEIQKVAFETIGKNRNDAFCVMMGRLNYAIPTEQTHWSKKGKGLKFTPLQAVLLALGKNKSTYSVQEDLVLFPKKSQTTDALMVLLKEKNGKYVPARDPISLEKCVVSMDPDFDEVFEVHEINRETLFFKADDPKENVTWVRHLKYQAKDVGTWRRRRNALANIMINKS